MNLPNLLRTSAFRLTLAYMALFAASVVVLLGFAYWATVSFLNERIDDDIEAEIGGLREQYHKTGLESLRQAIAGRETILDEADEVLSLARRDFSPMAGNLPAWPDKLQKRRGWAELITHVWEEDDGNLEKATVRALAVTLPGGQHLLVGRDLEDLEDLYVHILQVFAVTIGLSLILALSGGLVMSRAVLRRIETINRAGRSIMAGNLAQRMPVTGSGDEFDQLAANLNTMLNEIQRLMEGMRQVTDNVAHDLRNPLNRLRSRLEIILLTPRGNDDYRIAIEQTLSDADDLLRTFNALLSIAQIEAGAERGDWVSVDLTALAHDVAELYAPVAEDKGVQFTQAIAQGLIVQGNRHLLMQAIGNLLDNAIKYTPSGGAIQLSARVTDGGVEVLVGDTGPGIPAEMRDKVLERFTRLEASRTTPGNGLGLSMVRAVARLHDAKLELTAADPGLKVSLKLPGDAPRNLNVPTHVAGHKKAGNVRSSVA